MKARDVKTAEDAAALIRERGLTHVKVGIVDLDGIYRGKLISREKFLSSMKKGFGFCDVVFGWDNNDQLYPDNDLTGWRTAFPDATAVIDPASCRDVPGENGMVMFMASFLGEAGELCPRALLNRIIARGEAMGLTARVAAEFEFFVFEETAHSVREKDYKGLTNLTPGFFGYSMLRASTQSALYDDILAMAAELDAPIEGLHTETGPGVLEAAIEHAPTMEAADRAVLFKLFMKVLAQRQGKMATFMARWSNDWPGQSGHLHFSLADQDGPVFFDPDAPHTMSQKMRWFMGGLQTLAPEILAMTAHTVNSYSRLVPGFWAPTDATWGVENRTCALRVIQGSAASQRVEVRLAAADINPHLAIASWLGAGLYGIEHQIEPDAPIEGNAYAIDHAPERQLPRTLTDAANRLEASAAAADLFGPFFTKHYAMSRRWEDQEFRRSITDWELKRYFEII